MNATLALHTEGASRIENGRNESVTSAIQFILAVKCAVKTNLHFTLEKHAKPALLYERNIKVNLPESVPAWQQI